MDHVRCADDEALRALEEHGITRALVEAGGDIVVSAGWGKAREEIALSGLTVRPAASHVMWGRQASYVEGYLSDPNSRKVSKAAQRPDERKPGGLPLITSNPH